MATKKTAEMNGRRRLFSSSFTSSVIQSGHFVALLWFVVSVVPVSSYTVAW